METNSAIIGAVTRATTELITYSTYSTLFDPIRHIRMHITEDLISFSMAIVGCARTIYIYSIYVHNIRIYAPYTVHATT